MASVPVAATPAAADVADVADMTGPDTRPARDGLVTPRGTAALRVVDVKDEHVDWSSSPTAGATNAMVLDGGEGRG